MSKSKDENVDCSLGDAEKSSRFEDLKEEDGRYILGSEE